MPPSIGLLVLLCTWLLPKHILDCQGQFNLSRESWAVQIPLLESLPWMVMDFMSAPPQSDRQHRAAACH